MMFTESPATTLLMVALLEVGNSGATREHLVSKASIGTTTFYRVLKPLLEHNLVTQLGNRYFLPLSNWYNYRFKLLHDADSLYQLGGKDRNDILDVLQQAQHSLGQSLSCLWLVGSAAHNTLDPASDLDFLAVVRESTLYNPSATRPVNFVTMTEAEFRERYDARDGFVLSALQYGLLLLDRDFSQPYYAKPVPLEPPASDLHDSEQALEQRRKRLLAYLETDDLDLASRGLETLAVSLTRIILQTLGELPAGKTDLLRMAETLLGHRFHLWLRNALSGRPDRARLIALTRQWSDYRDRFFHNMSHLKTFSRLPCSRSIEFENLCLGVLRELFQSCEKPPAGDLGIDLLASSRETYAIALKSAERQIDPPALDNFVQCTKAWREGHHDKPIHALMIVNPCRSLPVAERPPLPPPLIAMASRSDVLLVPATGLLRAHNSMHLENATPQQALKQLLSASPHAA